MFWNKKTILLALALTLASSVQVAKADFTFGEPTNLGSAINSPDDSVITKRRSYLFWSL